MRVNPPRRLPWDSLFFGREIGRIELPEDGLEHVPEAGVSKLDCVYVFVAGDRLDLVQAAVSRGGRLVGARVELERTGPLSSTSLDRVRLARRDEEAMVVDAAARLAPESRFCNDPRFSRNRIDEMYRIWGRSCLESGVVVVPTEGHGALVGAREREGAAEIELVWVDSGARGRGLGFELVAAALSALDLGVARVATQAGNVSALRLYESLGFRTAAVRWIVHLWLDDRP